MAKKIRENQDANANNTSVLRPPISSANVTTRMATSSTGNAVITKEEFERVLKHVSRPIQSQPDEEKSETSE